MAPPTTATAVLLCCVALLASRCAAEVPINKTWTSNVPGEQAQGMPLEQVAITGVMASGFRPQFGALYKDTIMEEETRTGIYVNYTPPEAGINPFLSGDVAFAFTTAPLDAKAQKKVAPSHGGVLEIPIFLGTMSLFVNLPDVGEITLDGPTAARIFAGEIKRWDDQAIRDLNDGDDLPAEDIRLLVRKDNSSQTTQLSTWFDATYDAWPLGVDKVLPWNEYAYVAANGSAEMFGFLANTTYSIGYSETWAANNYSNAYNNPFREAKLVNNRGKAVTSKSASYDPISYPWPKPGESWMNVTNLAFQDKELHPLMYIAYALVSQDLSQNGTVGAAIKQMVGFWLSPDVQEKLVKAYRAQPLPDNLYKAAIMQWGEIKAEATPEVGWPQADIGKYTSSEVSSSRRRSLLEVVGFRGEEGAAHDSFARSRSLLF